MTFETVTATRVYPFNANDNGFRLRGLRLQSAITDGSPVVRLVITQPGVNVTNWLLDDWIIQGNGQEGNGLEIVCPFTSSPNGGSWMYRGCLRDLDIGGCGGVGLKVSGSVFEGSTFNVQCHDNSGSGAVFEHNVGQCSAWSLFGSNFRKNGGWGLELLNGCMDVRPFGGYWCENAAGAINADQGITSAFGIGAENNGMGLRAQNFAAMYGCNFSTDGRQSPSINGAALNPLLLVNTSNWDYGAGTSQFLQTVGSAVVTLDTNGVVVKST